MYVGVTNLRQEFKRLAANRWGDLSYALGGWSNERRDGHLDKWTPQTAMVSATINFSIATGRLEDRSDECREEDRCGRGSGTHKSLNRNYPRKLVVLSRPPSVDCAAVA